MNILALSGSLREASSNSAILRLLAHVASPEHDVRIFQGLAALPHFSPDLDRELNDPALPSSVAQLRALVNRADALIISCPEYAHGVPGSFKNALDWLVGGSEMVEKLFALYNTSPHATHAPAQLRETLRTMSARIAEDASLVIALPRGAGEDELAANEEISSAIGKSLDALARFVRGQQ